MKDILKDLSTPNLISAIENNVFEMFTVFRQWSKAEVHEEPTIKWSITDIPSNLGKHLELHSFVSEGDMPGMAVDLAELKENLLMPTGFHVQRVKDDATLKLWCQITCAGFGLPDFVAEAFYGFMSYVDQETMQTYLGYIDEIKNVT